jgi:putative ABC transport system permease protein
MLRNFLKIAFRNMARHKGFSFLNIAGLSFGLTACLLIGLFVWDEKQYDQNVADKDNIFRLYVHRVTNDANENVAMVPPAFAPTLQQEFAEVENATRVYRLYDKSLVEHGEKQVYQGGAVLAEPSFFSIFPLPFTHGSSAGALNDPKSILISEELSDVVFGPINPVGKELSVDKNVYLVKGVFQNDPKFHLKLNFILPFHLLTSEVPEERMKDWGWQQFFTYVKLKDGANAQALQAKFQKLAHQRGSEAEEGEQYNLVPYFQPLKDVHLKSSGFKFDMAVRGNATYVRALTIIAIFILLIACFNFVNLATAKSLQRAREVGVRKAIGAGRRQLMLQFIGETVLLSFISMVLAVGLTFVLLPWLNHFTEKQIVFPLFTDPLFGLLLLLLTLLVGVIAGFYPALVMSGFQPVKVLKASAITNTTAGKVPWLRHGLVVAQFAISVLLIVSAIVVYRQVNYLHHKDLGFNKEEIMFFPIRGDKMFADHESFKAQLEKVPGVSSVCVGYGFPGDATAGDNIIVPVNGEHKNMPAAQLLADHDYIKTLGLTVIAGRGFSKNMATDEDHAFVINETAVKTMGFGTPEKAIGKTLLWPVWESQQPDSIKEGKVIGVVKDFHFKSLYDKLQTTVIQIYPPAYSRVAVKFNTDNIDKTIRDVQEVWNRFSSGYPIEYIFLDENFKQMYKSEDKLKSLLSIFTAIAIFVACLGLFGLAAYAAERRRKEVGIRKVLGASVKGIVLLLSKDFVKLVLISFLFASPIAWYFMDKWLEDFAYRIDITWWMFGAAAIIAVSIALLTVSIQSLKAATASPTKNLRTE